MGSVTSVLWPSSATKRKAIGLTMAPERPLIEPLPWIVGFGANVSRSSSVMARTVLMVERASAPARMHAIAAGTMSVVFGVSLGITGIETLSLTTRG